MRGNTKTVYTHIIERGSRQPGVEARSLFCYAASHELGTSVTDLARLTGLTPVSDKLCCGKGQEDRGGEEFPAGMKYLRTSQAFVLFYFLPCAFRKSILSLSIIFHMNR